MRYDSDKCQLTDLTSEDLDEVIAWLERVRKNEYQPEPEWALACLEDGGFVRNESDRKFYTATKLYQDVALMVIRYLKSADHSADLSEGRPKEKMTVAQASVDVARILLGSDFEAANEQRAIGGWSWWHVINDGIRLRIKAITKSNECLAETCEHGGR